MDRLGTWEVPFHVHVRAHRQIGSPVEQWPGPGSPLRPTGSASCETRSEEDRVDPGAKQISDRICVAGSRSTSIVPVTSGNRTHRDPIEESGVPCGENRCRETRERTLSLTNLSTKRQRVAELARTQRGVALSTLHHLIDLEWMQEAYRLTRKDGAPGIDGVMADAYARNLEANLLDLLDRIKT